jgi:hypothetical protein
VALLALAFSGILPSPKPDERPFDALGALLLSFCMSALLLALVFSQRPAVAGWMAAVLAVVALAGVAADIIEAAGTAYVRALSNVVRKAQAASQLIDVGANEPVATP